MRICDICQQATTSLNILPEEIGQTEVCDTCRRRLLDLLQTCEQEVALQRIRLRQLAFEKWRRERSRTKNDINPPQ